MMQATDDTRTLTAANGIAFTARYLPIGALYGRGFDIPNTTEPMVEFYDTRHPFTGYGQFVSRYHVTTILGTDGFGGGVGGLDLNGGVSAWKIDADTMTSFREWLTGVSAVNPKRVDRQLAELHTERGELSATLETLYPHAHTLAGDTSEYEYRGRKRVRVWGMGHVEVLEILAANKGEEEVSHWLGEIDKRLERLEVIAALMDALDAVHNAHGWTRFFLVPGGHIHSGLQCAGGTVHVTTVIGWLPELSGDTVAEAVAQHDSILCTHCFPAAPVEWTRGKADSSCKANAIIPDSRYRRGSMEYAKCAGCGSVEVKSWRTGLLRKHKPKEADKG
jgi:hypothetical protein